MMGTRRYRRRRVGSMTRRQDRGAEGSSEASRAAVERLKYEVAQDLGLDDDIASRGFANMTTREVGKIGGHMVRRLVRRGERASEPSRPD